MRSSLSCDRCRKSKIKCVHEGTPPCNRCAKANAADCILIRPQTPNARSNSRRLRVSISRARSETESPSIVVSKSRQPPQQDGANRTTTPGQTPNTEDVEQHISSLSTGIILKCLNVFHNKFPELAILHLPTLSRDIQTGASPACTALLCAILAVTKPQLSILNVPWENLLLSGDEYARHAKELLTNLIFQPPQIYVVQALLIITLHEWGSRDFHKAWIYCGIAIRIIQALHSHRVAVYPLDPTSERDSNPTLRAIETRTYWGCFIMDCMVNSGTYNPPMLPMSEMKKLKIPRPPSVVDYAFGAHPPPPPPLPVVPPPSIEAVENRIPVSNDAPGVFDMTQGFELLVTGFDIWTQLMTFIFNDGRRAPGMCAAENCPWVQGSPWWSTRNRLETWRASQPRKMIYPDVPVAVHMTLGYGETFVYLNLLYYLSTLMLHREYFPFLPTVDLTPRGPIDHPMLEATAPEGWWNDSATELFGAAKNIAHILKDASECGVDLMTPFAGFCSFSSGYINLYGSYFPLMNLNRSPNASADLKLCLDYLEDFRHVWKIADGWLKTIQHASMLYERAVSDRRQYQGKSSRDFITLHQSVHEFRVVDRSDQHTKEINVAANQMHGSGLDEDEDMDTGALLTQLMAEVSSNLDEQGAWSQWWPPMEDIELPSTVGS